MVSIVSVKRPIHNWKAHLKLLVHRTKAFISVAWPVVWWLRWTDNHHVAPCQTVCLCLMAYPAPFRFSLSWVSFECLLTKIKRTHHLILTRRDALSPSFSLALLELFFITVSHCSKYGAPQTADLGWTADPCISNSTPKVPRLQGLPPCGCGRSAASVIHPLARSPASEYWFLFPQSPGERGRKD